MPEASLIGTTSPLITLVGVGVLDLLPRVYGEIEIPAVVQHEYNVRARDSVFSTWNGFHRVRVRS